MSGPATQTEVEGSIPEYSPEQEQPLGGYAVLMSVFAAASGAFMLWLRRSSRELPERISSGDLALVTVATHKAARTLAKDRVTSVVRAPFTRFQADGGPGEVEERARGRGLRRAIGELLICPFCLGLWIATAFTAGLVVAPRPTRWIASVLVAHFGSEVLQIAYRRLEDTG
jgi:Flp pilus assembly protein TadB